ncbi:DUF3068 domain-containing protein [Nocardiopsis algeriensis]|uniref:DUF3068 family protein n=1 Tax=Nocardiopsis algeriensis TaxID=1478215 RepID=A0A841IJ03_9ACTN|nr:DUF3068 domain-containing protein [Nocardiopsis algeriensis]MBB6118717.1 hypothetical protein [Nocardiopsis algeriensis]
MTAVPGVRGPLPGGTILLAAGAFLLTLAVLLPLHVYERVALLPAEEQFEISLVAEDAGYLDTSTWEWRQAARVVRTTRVDATPHGGDWSAWETSVATSTDEGVLDHWSRRVIVDRRTGRAVNCCGEHVDGDRAVRQAGLVFSWPVGAPEGDHPFYDAEVRSAPPMEFQGTEEVAGIEVRRYTQTIDATQVPGSARQVPASLFTPGAEGTVSAARWLRVVRTYWVEPVSGAVVDIAEERHETMRPRTEGEEIDLLHAEFSLAEGQVVVLAEHARVRSFLLATLRDRAPAVLGPLGALAVLAGVVRARRSRVPGGAAGREGAPV